jgi:GxxExxY protein
VNSAVIVELKVAQNIDIAHEKQIMNYLKATDLEVGMIFNFGPRAQFRRLVFENQRKACATAMGRINS